MTITYRLDPQDSLAGLLAKLQAAPGERVLFVVPDDAGGVPALTAVGLRALRRAAVQGQVSLALVTAQPALRSLAAREGISTYREQARAEQATWHRLRRDRRISARPPSPAATEAPPAAGLFERQPPSGFRPVAFVRAFAGRLNPWWANLGLMLFLALLFLGLLYTLSLIVPAATVTLVPVAEPLKATASLRGVQDAALNLDAGIVPAQVMSVQVTGEAKTETTGRRAEPSGVARGSVTFINRTSRSITVPANTIVSTATGNNVQFTTTAALALPPGGRAATPVVAVLPGPSGNVRAGTITRVEGGLSLSLAVANSSAFVGGTTAQMGVVTEEDKARLQAQLFEELKQQALERLQERSKGSQIQPDSISYLALSPSFAPFVGEVAPELFLSMSVQAVGLVVDQDGADQVALAALQAAMPPNTRLIASSVRTTNGPAVVEDAQTVAFTVLAEGTLLRGLDVAAVRRAIVGLSTEEAARVLADRFPLAVEPQIRLGPDWLPLIVPVDLPILPWRIRVIVDWDAAARLAGGR